jgi:hypothetical protein
VAVEKNNIVHKLINSENKSGRQRFFALFFVCSLVSIFYSSRLEAQSQIEFGGLGGAAYYIGDLNPGVPFVNVNPALGGIGRYVFSDRIAFKAAVTVAGLSGDYDKDKVGVLPEFKRLSGSPGYFKRTVMSLDFTGEINLFSYDHKYISSTVFTPYLSFGFGAMGYSKIVAKTDTSTTFKPSFSLSLPMGVGVKYKISKRLRIGAEWTFYKLFVDDVDNYSSIGNALTHNNDWFSVFKIYITFGFLRRKSECFGMCTRTIEDRRKK